MSLATQDAATGFVPLRVLTVDRLTDDSVAVELARPLDGSFAFAPGQHLTLRRVVDGVDVRRTYSLCTSAGSGRLRIAVKQIEGGAFSTWVVDALRAGDVVEVLPPAGRFGPVLHPAAAHRYVCFAAGSGITPMASIVASVLETEPQSTVALVFGNRTSRDVMLLEELADLKDSHPGRFELLHVLSREEQDAELLTGRIDGDRVRRLLATLLPPAGVDGWFVCGPFAMVTGVRDTLVAAGVDPSRVHVELFHAEPPPPRARVATAGSRNSTTVHALLHGRATTVQVGRAGDSVLDAVLAARADAPYACKSGVCGTCRARVVEGAVEMDVNYALEPDELTAGIVLTCQSHPTTDVVRLEFG